MFPDGVIYEGVDDEKPQYFRGESGANDSMSVTLVIYHDSPPLIPPHMQDSSWRQSAGNHCFIP